jgi:hypothetical protein
MPSLNNDSENADFFFIESETPEDTLNKIIELAAKRIPKKVSKLIHPNTTLFFLIKSINKR